MKYLIHWKSLTTRHTGHGTLALPLDTAKAWLEELEEQYHGKIIHWIEEAQDEVIRVVQQSKRIMQAQDIEDPKV